MNSNESVSNIYSILKQIGVRPSKDYGQNFLIDAHAVTEIVDFARPQSSEKVLEIGPGLGALTEELHAICPDLTVIELEGRFCKYLATKLPGLNIINEDVRFVDFSELGGKLTVFGNLPYSFSSEIILHLLEFSDSVSRAIVMLQKEFAERLAAQPGSRKYGILTVLTQLKAEALLGPIINGDSFYPAPDVQSQMIELRFYSEPKYQINDNLTFKKILHGVFKERRKKIPNTLVKVGYDKDRVLSALATASIPESSRPEDVSVEQYVKLANTLS